MLTRTGKKVTENSDKKGSPKTLSKVAVSTRGKMEDELKKIKEQLKQFSSLNTEIKELRARQEKFDEMERELQELRLKCNENQERTQSLRNNGDNPIVSNLLIDIQRMSLDIKAPKFSDEDSKHPIEYVNDLENYLNARRIVDSARLLVISNSLSGKAKYWYENNKQTITSFESFKEQFKKAFFSIPIQMKIKEKWQNRRYKEEEKSLEVFFSEQLKVAQYFEPKMLNFEINFKIAQQLPWRAREALAGADFENAQTVVTRLQYLDLNPLDKTGEKETENNGKSENNQIRNLTVKESKSNDGKENAKSFNQNKVYRKEDRTYNNYNQRNGYRNYGYERDNRQYGRNGSNCGDLQVGDWYNRNNFRYRNNGQYSFNNYNNRFNNANRFNAYYNNRQMENQQGYYNRANVQDMRSRAMSQPWRRNSQMPFASSNNRYVNIGDNNNTDLTDVSQPSMNYQNTNNRQHLN